MNVTPQLEKTQSLVLTHFHTERGNSHCHLLVDDVKEKELQNTHSVIVGYSSSLFAKGTNPSVWYLSY